MLKSQKRIQKNLDELVIDYLNFGKFNDPDLEMREEKNLEKDLDLETSKF